METAWNFLHFFCKGQCGAKSILVYEEKALFFNLPHWRVVQFIFESKSVGNCSRNPLCLMCLKNFEMNERHLKLMFHWRAPSETIYGHSEKVCPEYNISIVSNLHVHKTRTKASNGVRRPQSKNYSRIQCLYSMWMSQYVLMSWMTFDSSGYAILSHTSTCKLTLDYIMSSLRQDTLTSFS